MRTNTVIILLLQAMWSMVTSSCNHRLF